MDNNFYVYGEADEDVREQMRRCMDAGAIGGALMADNHKSRIMCIDKDGLLVGVISLSDIAQHESGRRAAETLKQVSEREART